MTQKKVMIDADHFFEMTQIIAGEKGPTYEYSMVMKQSKNPSLMLLAHSIHVDKQSALELIERYSMPDTTVRFTLTKVSGRAAVGLNGFKVIWLNPNQITIGIVLHEISHLINDVKRGKHKPHGPEFVEIFDSLIDQELGANIGRWLQAA